MYGLLIADDPDDVAIFSVILQRAGLAVSTAGDLEQAIQNWTERPADLVLVSLPDVPPQEQVRRIRAETLSPLILVLNSADERLHAQLLKMGADLVITAPFGVKVR